MSGATDGCERCRDLDRRTVDIVWLLTSTFLLLTSLGMPWLGGSEPGSLPEVVSREPRAVWDLPPDFAQAENIIYGLALLVVILVAIAATGDDVESAVGAAVIISVITVIFLGALIAAIRTDTASVGSGMVVTVGASSAVAFRCMAAARWRAASRTPRSPRGGEERVPR
ncbi:hypothetical protein [Actinomadura rugatobispora]|uniref:DUF998 domain-containing protein n=1 Tax=Actinomadura rugatobispora TaxID=1994 RepID=A0ABW1AAV6_9ACTN|nr:hypothetical protein GCM10010200_047420 [Actinomadura rugatobispora]